MNEWIRVEDDLPPDGEIVLTKIDDEQGCRNIALRYRYKNRWCLPDGSMYVYYAPTHWRRTGGTSNDDGSRK